MTESSNDRSTWAMGSVEYFREEWTRQLNTASFIFPRDRPTSQWDAFELHKARAILEMMRSRIGDRGRVLEFGCGAAGILIYLMNQGYSGVGLDVTREALEIASANDAQNKVGLQRNPLQLVNADVLHLPFEDCAFDCVISNGLLEHFSPESVPTLLHEVVRVLRPRGFFVSDIAHARLSTRQLAMPLNFTVAFLAATARNRSLPAAKLLWKSVKSPMYENAFGRSKWREEIERAGLVDVEVNSFRLLPPVSLPRVVDHLYGQSINAVAPLRWAVDVHSWSMPLGWLYLATGTRS